MIKKNNNMLNLCNFKGKYYRILGLYHKQNGHQGKLVFS